MLTRSVAPLIAVLLAGCAEVAATPAPSDATVTPPSTPSTISLAPSGSSPAIAHEALDAGFVLGAAAIRVDGLAHLWTVTFSTEEGIPPSVRHLTSTDGRTWDADPEPVELEDTSLGINEVGPVPSSALVDDDGTWLLYGGARLAGSDAPIVWRATARGPDGPWAMHPEPVLTPSADGCQRGHRSSLGPAHR